MPIYEFVCQECGHKFEKILSFSDSSVPTCPTCGADQVVRQIGRPAIHFKGSGWYITDSKADKKSANGNGHSNGNGSSSDSTESESKKAESSTESSKPEAGKSESKQTEKDKAS